MPEGHTIHRIAQDHGALLVGHAVAVTSPQGRFTADAERVNGVVLDELEAYGKHLFYWWHNGEVGHVHLGLFGKFRVHHGPDHVEPQGMVRMRMRVPAATIDLAGPTACSIGTPHDRELILKRLGPDPLRADAQPELAIERIERSAKAIGALLLDQAVLCGVGNVYRAEALFVNGINPRRAGRDIERAELELLWNTIVAMLRKGVLDNRIITIDDDLFTAPMGAKARRGETNYVYHRDRCLRCDTPIQTVELAGRACYFCPSCQPR